MKHAVAVLALTLALTLAGCTKDNQPQVTPSPSSSTAVTPEATTPAETVPDGDHTGSDAAGDLGDAVGDVADGVGDAVGDVANGVGDAAERVGEDVSRAVH